MRTFSALRANALERRDLKDRAQSVARMFKNSKLMGAVRNWRERASEAARLRGLLRRVGARMRKHTLCCPVRARARALGGTCVEKARRRA